ncbi:MAG: metal ABC transporter substrate-binding protein [candidate division WOR-3 bacterium]
MSIEQRALSCKLLASGRELLVVLLMLAGCGMRDAEGRRRHGAEVRVVVTIPDLADWVKNVGGERVKVTSLLTGSEDPHNFEPRPADALAIAQAQILVRVGLGLDDWLGGIIENARNPKLVVLTIGDEIDVIQEHHEFPGHSHPEGNPHIWLDPEIARAAVGLIAGALSKVDTAGQRFYEQQAQNYSFRLDSATRVLQEVVARLPNRKIVTVHESWPYFCRRFGFEAVAALEPLPGQEPSAREMVELSAGMKAESVRVIVVEPQHNRDVADALARETGGQVVVLSSVTGGLKGTESYLQLLDYNVRTLAQALSPK